MQVRILPYSQTFKTQITKKQNTEVAVRGDLLDTIDMIELKIKQLKKTGEKPYQTNGQFKYSPNMTIFTNIHDNESVPVLLGCLGAVINHFNNYEAAAKLCELKEYPQFTWLGFTLEAWTNDIQIRVWQLTQRAKFDKLQKAKKTLEGFMTKEDQLSKVLEEIKAISL